MTKFTAYEKYAEKHRLEHNHCDTSRCRRPWEIKYLGKRLCQTCWLKLCTDDRPKTSRRLQVAPAPYIAKAPAYEERFYVSDWLPLDLGGVE